MRQERRSDEARVFEALEPLLRSIAPDTDVIAWQHSRLEQAPSTESPNLATCVRYLVRQVGEGDGIHKKAETLIELLDAADMRTKAGEHVSTDDANNARALAMAAEMLLAQLQLSRVASSNSFGSSDG